MTNILAEEKINKLLYKFSLPCVMGLLIGAFYNIVDQIFIGNSSLGYLGNAATGISFPIICIANAFAWCIGDGAASYLSICAGRKDSDSAHHCVGTGITTTFIISIVFGLLCIIYARPLMNLFGASSQTLDLAYDYFVILATFFPAYLLFNVMNSMIRADGSPTYAMLALLIGAVINIILDPIFIFILDLGIKGAAYATVIGQVISFIICALYFRKPKSFKLSKESFKINYPTLKSVVILGSSTFIIQISMVIMTLLSNVMLNKFGALSIYGSDIPISVYSIQTKVYTIVCNIVVGIALGGQPILGYNYGAKKMKRVRECYGLILKATLFVGVIASLIFLIYPQMIIRIFGVSSDVYMEFAVASFRISLGLCFITCFIKISSIFFQAIGKPKEAMVASIIRDSICFVILTIVLCNLIEKYYPGNGVYGILLAAPLSDMVAGTTIAIVTYKFFKHLAKEDASLAKTEIKASRPGQIITINRLHGTGAKKIAANLADELHIPLYYKELNTIIEKESGIASEYLSHDFDQNEAGINEFMMASDVYQNAINAESAVINKIADKGSCIIVGRAASHILKDHRDVVRIFLYAPKDYRLYKITKMYGDDYEEAKRQIERSDNSRSTYYENITAKKWRDINNYDLCLDVSVGEEKITKTILAYINAKAD